MLSSKPSCSESKEDQILNSLHAACVLLEWLGNTPSDEAFSHAQVLRQARMLLGDGLETLEALWQEPRPETFEVMPCKGIWGSDVNVVVSESSRISKAVSATALSISDVSQMKIPREAQLKPLSSKNLLTHWEKRDC